MNASKPTEGNPKRNIWQHESQHAVYYAAYAAKVINAWEQMGKLCIPIVCEHWRQDYLRMLTAAYEDERNWMDALLERQDYASVIPTSDPNIYKNAMEDELRIARMYRKDLNECLQDEHWLPIESWPD